MGAVSARAIVSAFVEIWGSAILLAVPSRFGTVSPGTPHLTVSCSSYCFLFTSPLKALRLVLPFTLLPSEQALLPSSYFNPPPLLPSTFAIPPNNFGDLHLTIFLSPAHYTLRGRESKYSNSFLLQRALQGHLDRLIFWPFPVPRLSPMASWQFTRSPIHQFTAPPQFTLNSLQSAAPLPAFCC